MREPPAPGSFLVFVVGAVGHDVLHFTFDYDIVNTSHASVICIPVKLLGITFD
jgi:hypothetical protein